MNIGGSAVALATAVAHDGALDILAALAIVLCVAAVTTVIFQRIHQPVVLGYLLAGVIVGPHELVPVFADVEITRLFADLGVILLMFSLGLDFSLRKLARVAPTAGIIAIVECSLMIWMGYTVADLLGWSFHERLFTGAFVAISSTTIIVKAFAERGIKGKLGDIVLGILIVEDLVAILLLAILTTVASGAGLSAGALAATVARLAGFLAGMLIGGLLIVPRLVRLITRLGRKETTVVACVGICFASALIARKFGYSVALGAFLGGLLVAESGESHAIEKLIEPVRDIFAAVFFVSVGMLIDPKLFVAHWPAIAVLTAVVMTGKIIGVTSGAFIAGSGVPTSIKAGMSLAQIGEFSFIIVGVGVSLGAVRDFIYPIAVAISAITTLATPWLIRLSGPAANVIDRRMPHAMQTYAALYGSWIQQMRGHSDGAGRDAAAAPTTAGARIGRLVTLMFVDVGLAAAILIAAFVNIHRLTVIVGSLVDLRLGTARYVVGVGAVVIAGPFVVGAVRVARALGVALAMRALPSAQGGLDLADAPRRALLVTVQLSILLVAGLPLVAITQPLLPHVPWLAVLAVGVALLGIQLWRGAANLQGHVRASAQVILEAVASQRQARETSASATHDVKKLVPGMGDATAVRLDEGSVGTGRTLKQMNLRGRTGASVIAIEHAGGQTAYPGPEDRLRAGDTLVLTGTLDAVEAARRLLTSGQSDGDF
ncbi:MAG: cation:proton antiporter [Verrucomicrobiota bacterium]